MNTKYIGILLMAGKSTRMNGIVKQYYVSKDDDEPMYIRSLKTLVSFMDDVILVVPHGDEEKVKSQSFIFAKKFYPVISGGKNRTESVRNALNFIKNMYFDVDIKVLIHDAARPFVPSNIILNIKDALKDHDAVTPVLDMLDSLLKENDGIKYVDRTSIKRVQTPQGFDFNLIYEAYEELKEESKTDDFQMVLNKSKSPILIHGSTLSFKVTNDDDLVIYDCLSYKFKQ